MYVCLPLHQLVHMYAACLLALPVFVRPFRLFVFSFIPFHSPLRREREGEDQVHKSVSEEESQIISGKKKGSEGKQASLNKPQVERQK